MHNLHALTAEAVEALKRNLPCCRPCEVTAAARIVDIGLKFSVLADISRRLDNLEAERRQDRRLKEALG